MPATYDDAGILMQIVRWGTEMGIEEACRGIFSDDFDPKLATVDDRPVAKMVSFFETVSTLVKHGVLDKQLVLDLFWISGTWARVGPAATRGANGSASRGSTRTTRRSPRANETARLGGFLARRGLSDLEQLQRRGSRTGRLCRRRGICTCGR